MTTLQALVLLFLHECVSGRDRIGRTYYLLAMDMWRRLGFNQSKSRPYECEESGLARQDWRAMTVAVWGIFCVEKCVLLALVGSCYSNFADTAFQQLHVLSYRFRAESACPCDGEIFRILFSRGANRSRRPGWRLESLSNAKAGATGTFGQGFECSLLALPTVS